MAKKEAQSRHERDRRSRNRSASSRQIVGELESGKLGLSDALARYEQGVKHLKACQQLLERAERKIELLSGVDAEATRSPSRSTNGTPIRWKKRRPPAAGAAQATRKPRPAKGRYATTT